MNMKNGLSDFWTQTLSGTLGTVIGIIVTFGTTAWLQYREQQATERTAALMVIHNLDNFCDRLANDVEDLKTADSLNYLVWRHSPDHLDQLADSTLQMFMNNLLSRNFTVDDQTAENIFSTNIDTWKNISSSEFIEQAGECFSAKRMLTKLRGELDEDKRKIYNSIMTATSYTDKPAMTLREAVARVFWSADLCCFIQKQHEYYLGGMRAGLGGLREHNEENKKLMNVTDEELRQFGVSKGRRTYIYN